MSESEPALHLLLNAIWRRRSLGAMTAATTLAILAAVALGLPNVYRSSAVLLVNEGARSPSATNAASDVSVRLESIRQDVLSRQTAIEFLLHRSPCRERCRWVRWSWRC
jgi:uncharacterized protein involved in exopolysaccharide biosynthesis